MTETETVIEPTYDAERFVLSDELLQRAFAAACARRAAPSKMLAALQLFLVSEPGGAV